MSIVIVWEKNYAIITWMETGLYSSGNTVEPPYNLVYYK